MFTVIGFVCLYADCACTDTLGVNQVWLKIVDYRARAAVSYLNLDSRIFLCHLHDKLRKGLSGNGSCDCFMSKQDRA